MNAERSRQLSLILTVLVAGLSECLGRGLRTHIQFVLEVAAHGVLLPVELSDQAVGQPARLPL